MSRGYKRVGYLPRLGAPFLLVLVACAVAMQSKTDPQHVSAAAAAVAPGMIVMVVIYVAGGVSGAHINPAVTLGFALRRTFDGRIDESGAIFSSRPRVRRLQLDVDLHRRTHLRCGHCSHF